MAQNFTVRNAVGYKCDTCHRTIKLAENRLGIELTSRCIITAECQGKMRRLLTQKEINNAPVIPPSIDGLNDWFQRKVLYTHVQTIKSSVWLVEHGLGSKTSVQVQVERADPQDSTKTILIDVIPLITETVDLNTIRLTFDKNEAGVAQCVGSTSGTTTIQPIETTFEPVQITNRGVLTLATLDATPSIEMTAVFSNTHTTQIEYVGVSTFLNTASPWTGANKTFINGKIYTTRTLDVVNTPPAPSFFSSGLIENGSLFTFSDIITPGQYLIIFGKEPYGIFDKIINQYIDIGTINNQLPELFYNQGEIFAQATIIKTTYPHIIVVD